MSLATTYCRANVGIQAPLITVETHLANGLPAFNIVGLGEKAVQESRDRVRSALLNSAFEFPARRITVNLAPAELPKQGSRFDLAIAIGILVASGQLPWQQLEHYEFIGELTLAGGVRPVTGILPVALATRQAARTLVLPRENLTEASLSSDSQLLPIEHLLSISAHLSGRQKLQTERDSTAGTADRKALPDLADVRGQAVAKRALEITAAGGHNLLMMGPPGSGKSMLASRLPGILPEMTEQEALESAAIASIAGTQPSHRHWKQRPFRAPHHTSSGVALVGGGSSPRPGEISLAHHGVLFLDELPEFNKHALEVLREPLETGHITISRASRSAEFPARFQLIAAMNPCKCGYAGDPGKACSSCTLQHVSNYQSRISGPLRDRIDLQIEVPAVTRAELFATDSPGESSAQVRSRVTNARKQQLQRQKHANAYLQGTALEQYCHLTDDDQLMLADAIERLGLSARAYHRILRVARTIADLAVSSSIGSTHLLEAIGYRRLDRK